MTRFRDGLIGALFVVGGLLHAYVSAATLLEAFHSRNWPSTSGKILTAEVIYQSQSRSPYSARVEYVYSAAGGTHRGSGIGFKDLSGDKDFAEKAVAPYVAGGGVLVYFNPSNPDRSVLAPGPTWQLASWTILSVIIVAIGSFHFVRSGRQRSEPNDA